MEALITRQRNTLTQNDSPHTDFCTADVDSQTSTMTRKSIAVALAPDMRTLQQHAERELNSGSMTGALLLS